MFVEILNEKINYVFEDTGKTKVLFLHGFNSNLKFATSIYHLEKNYDVVAFDFPGCGESSINDFASIDYYQNIAIEFVKQMNLNKFFIVGHSLGGASAAKIAAQMPERVLGVIFAAPINPYVLDYKKNPFGLTVEQIKQRLNSWLLPNNQDEAESSTEHLTFQNPLYLEKKKYIAKSLLNLANIRRTYFLKMVIQEITNYGYLHAELKELYFSLSPDIPKLFVVGEKDFFVSSESVQQIAQDLSSPIEIIPKTGHALFFENPNKLKVTLETFIAKQKIN